MFACTAARPLSLSLTALESKEGMLTYTRPPPHQPARRVTASGMQTCTAARFLTSVASLPGSSGRPCAQELQHPPSLLPPSPPSLYSSPPPPPSLTPPAFPSAPPPPPVLPPPQGCGRKACAHLYSSFSPPPRLCFSPSFSHSLSLTRGPPAPASPFSLLLSLVSAPYFTPFLLPLSLATRPGRSRPHGVR
eukprot:353147-Chlamydomonas_euryale.AAC.1